jgi:hypothetical protein
MGGGAPGHAAKSLLYRELHGGSGMTKEENAEGGHACRLQIRTSNAKNRR